ncbi:MAG: rod shape-determining protein MreC [Candidatus Omnitrophica bacterium]|nr:rod shape-determining protein MreC [Candidatus Omnitrophota bacterium]
MHFSRKRLFAIGLLLLFFLSLLFGNSPPFRLLRTSIADPSFTLLRVSTLFLNDLLYLSRNSRLVGENRLLKRKVALLKEEVSSLQEDLQQSHRFSLFSEFQKAHSETRGLFCRIIGRDPSRWNQIILLDKGKKEGLQEDMAVLGMEGLVGRLIQVEESWSKALLITDPNSKVGAVLERSREVGLLVGESRGLLFMEYLSPGADVREGDRVLTAGFGEIFPKGIVIGEVVGFGRREEDLLMYALVKPIERLSQLEEVLCVQR